LRILIVDPPAAEQIDGIDCFIFPTRDYPAMPCTAKIRLALEGSRRIGHVRKSGSWLECFDVSGAFFSWDSRIFVFPGGHNETRPDGGAAVIENVETIVGRFRHIFEEEPATSSHVQRQLMENSGLIPSSHHFHDCAPLRSTFIGKVGDRNFH
jgi:hypothetical protein